MGSISRGMLDPMEDTLVEPPNFHKRQDIDKTINHFIIPADTGEMGPNNSVVSIGSPLDLKWVTELNNFDLMLYQQLQREPECASGGCVDGPYPIANNLSDNHYIWTVTTGTLDLTSANTFFLLAREVGSSRQFGSSYMNFTTETGHSPKGVTTSSASQTLPSTTSELSSSPTSLIPTSPISSSSTTTSTSETIGIATSTSGPSSPTTSKKGLSSGAIAGIAVVLTLLVVIALVLGWYFGYWKRKQRSHFSEERVELQGNPRAYSDKEIEPQELEAKSRRKTMGPFEIA